MKEQIIEIREFNHDGRGRGVLDGKTYLVSQAYPGERVSVIVDRSSSKTVQGRVANLHEVIPERIDSPCVHLNHCTGCPFIGVTSAVEEDFKRNELNRILSDAGSGASEIQYIRPTGAYHYRHYAKWNLIQTGNRISVGAYVMGTHSLVENQKCQVVTPMIQRVVSRVLNILNRFKVKIHSDKNRGLRYLIIRQSHVSDRLLLTIVDSREMFQTEKVRYRLKPEFEKLTEEIDVAWMVNVDDGNVLLSSEWQPLVGDCILDEALGGIELKVGPETFFQINPCAAEEMFQLVASWLDGRSVLELFSGVGALSVLLASKVDKLCTLEVNAASVDLANKTMKTLGHDHVTCLQGDAYRYDVLVDRNQHFDTLVVDPPGKGLGSELIERIIKSDATQLIMLACRATGLRRDLPLLLGGGFKVERVGLVDQFPRTGHFETMLKLVR